MPVSKKSTKKTAKRTTKKSGKKTAKSSFTFNPMDPHNQFPNYKTGEEEYGPIPPFGYNKHDVMNMKPFNPNVMNAMMGGPLIHPPAGGVLIPPPFNMLGLPGAGFPNPSMPLLQPMVPSLPSPSPGVSTLPALPTPGATSLFPFGSPSVGLQGYGFGTHTLSPQQYHPTDPNNQFPNPLTGSMSQPGPALEGGMNAFDPYNVIGAPQGSPAQNHAMRNNMKSQPRHPRSPYILD